MANKLQIHFQFASDAGSEVGDAVGQATLDAFDANWDNFERVRLETQSPGTEAYVVGEKRCLRRVVLHIASCRDSSYHNDISEIQPPSVRCLMLA